MMQSFPVQLKLRLDWSEMDLFGHINNVSFFKYIQASRVNYWEAVGIDKMLAENRIGPILASCNCQFKKPLYYPGEILVQARLEFIKTTSFSFFHQIIDTEGEVAAEAQDVMVMFDFNKNEKVAFPEEIKRRIEALEGKKLR